MRAPRATGPGPLAWDWPRPCAVALVAALALILSLTLVPEDGPAPVGFRWRLFAGAFDLPDSIGNIGLFVPLGAALRCSGVSGWRTVASGFALSAAIEVTQLWVVPGRDPCLSDILANSSGTALGASLAHWYPTRRRSALRAVAAASASLAAMAVVGLLVRPSFPRTPYFGQWTADLGMYGRYGGRVLSAEIGGLPLPSTRLAASTAVRESLRAGTEVRIRAVAGPPPARLAPIFSIFDSSQREILLLGPEGDDLVLHVRQRAEDARLRSVDLRWPGALAAVATDDALTLRVRRETRGYCLTVNGRERCGLCYSVGRAWALLLGPPGQVPAGRTLLDAATMLLLGLPVGIVGARGRGGRAGLVLVLAGAVVVPWSVGLSPTPLLQLAALALGVFAGSRAP